MVKEKYQREISTAEPEPLTTETFKNWFASAKEGDNLKKFLVPKTSKLIIIICNIDKYMIMHCKPDDNFSFQTMVLP